ncbi:accessory gene regulator B family protein [Clostridium sp. Marseille-P2415]|uniref:accessory gene regulator B family protein n=1 Tax=Clostridium sp. Marseille-P2415 TaxID=1805471 RepID=UPI0013566B8D|nr:accessory gene regulator B family protein [Clostridium sp. Marseille-P2415]
MVITKFSAILCGLLNKINPRSDEDNIAIQYGFELILDNIIKLFFLQMLGAFLGKGWETFIILFSFCLLRLQAGGIHARTNIGCSLGMILVWGLSLVGSVFIKIKVPFLILLYVICAIVVAYRAPRSKNISHFTYSSKLKKKFVSLVILTLIMVIAYMNESLRELLVYPVTLEVLTLLPENNTAAKGE